MKTACPDFIIVGAQKSATTFLREYLIWHSQVCFPDYPKEMHCFSFNIRDRIEDYNAVFESCNCDKISGEKSPSYFHMRRKRIEILKAECDSPKIIIILRNPMERALSQAKMEVSQYHRKDLSKKDIVKMIFNLQVDRNLERGNYSKSLSNWYSVFEKEKIYIDFYENLARDQTQFIRNLCDFLKIEFKFPDYLFGRKVYKSKEFLFPLSVIKHLKRRSRKQYKELITIGLHPPESWDDSRRGFNINLNLGWMFLWFVIIPFSSAYNAIYYIYRLIKDKIDIYNYYMYKKMNN